MEDVAYVVEARVVVVERLRVSVARPSRDQRLVCVECGSLVLHSARVHGAGFSMRLFCDCQTTSAAYEPLLWVYAPEAGWI